MRLQGEQPVGPPSPWLPVWVPERRLAVSAAELGAGWAGEREDTCFALQRVGAQGKGASSSLESACGHLDAQIQTFKPLRGQFIQLSSSVLDHAAGVSDITQAQYSSCKQILLACML